MGVRIRWMGVRIMFGIGSEDHVAGVRINVGWSEDHVMG